MNDTDEKEFIRQQFKEVYNIFRKDAYTRLTPNMCKIHDAFGSRKDERHNCLGCNFADSTNLIKSYLSRYKSFDGLNEVSTIYILTLYLLVERMEVVFNLISLSQTYKDKHFKVFQRIRKWANFLKHPKSFILVHHPNFIVSDWYEFDKNDYQVVIDDLFIDKYYKGESDPSKQYKTNEELLNILKLKNNIIVVYPNFLTLTKNLTFAMNHFVKLITKNEIFIELLNDTATIDKYFINDYTEF